MVFRPPPASPVLSDNIKALAQAAVAGGFKFPCVESLGPDGGKATIVSASSVAPPLKIIAGV